MSHAEKFVAAQAKAIKSAHELANLAIENAMAITTIHFDLTKNAVETTHSKATHILALKEAKEVFELFKLEEVQGAISEASITQGKVAKVISKSNKAVVEMVESSIDDSQAELRQIVKEVCCLAPANSEPAISMFEYMFDATLQSLDQAYSVSKDAYAHLEKGANSVMSSFQDQFATASKPATKSRKAIAA